MAFFREIWEIIDIHSWTYLLWISNLNNFIRIDKYNWIGIITIIIISRHSNPRQLINYQLAYHKTIKTMLQYVWYSKNLKIFKLVKSIFIIVFTFEITPDITITIRMHIHSIIIIHNQSTLSIQTSIIDLYDIINLDILTIA